MRHPESEQLSAFAEGRVQESRLREEVERHVADCAECLSEVEWIQELRTKARSLNAQEVPPPEGLWARVEAGIHASGRPTSQASAGDAPPTTIDLAQARRGRGGGGGGWTRYTLQAAAVLALTAISSFAALTLLRTGSGGADGPDGSAGTPALVAEGEAPGEAIRFVSAMEELESAYAPAIRELERALERDRGNLAPATIQVLEENLRIIDEAIRDALTALAADPGSSMATGLVGGMYETKLQVLQQAVRLAQGV
jgi:hypothetical protein